jgi:hypothetical protein
MPQALPIVTTGSPLLGKQLIQQPFKKTDNITNVARVYIEKPQTPILNFPNPAKNIINYANSIKSSNINIPTTTSQNIKTMTGMTTPQNKVYPLYNQPFNTTVGQAERLTNMGRTVNASFNPMQREHISVVNYPAERNALDYAVIGGTEWVANNPYKTIGALQMLGNPSTILNVMKSQLPVPAPMPLPTANIPIG